MAQLGEPQLAEVEIVAIGYSAPRTSQPRSDPTMRLLKFVPLAALVFLACPAPSGPNNITQPAGTLLGALFTPKSVFAGYYQLPDGGLDKSNFQLAFIDHDLSAYCSGSVRPPGPYQYLTIDVYDPNDGGVHAATYCGLSQVVGYMGNIYADGGYATNGVTYCDTGVPDSGFTMTSVSESSSQGHFGNLGGSPYAGGSLTLKGTFDAPNCPALPFF